MILWPLLKRHCRRYTLDLLIVIVATSVTVPAPSSSARLHASASGTTRISADVCSRHPELFKVRSITADEGRRFAKAGEGVPTITGFNGGTVVSGPCVRFVKSFGGVVTLANNDQFVISDSALVSIPPGSDLPPSFFKPPKNIMTIASDKFAEGKGRSFVKSIDNGADHTALWSGPKGSAIGTIRCDKAGTACTLKELILSSPYRIRNFGFVPPPHAETRVGSLWFWATLRPGEEALVGYTFAYGSKYSETL